MGEGERRIRSHSLFMLVFQAFFPPSWFPLSSSLSPTFLPPSSPSFPLDSTLPFVSSLLPFVWLAATKRKDRGRGIASFFLLLPLSNSILYTCFSSLFLSYTLCAPIFHQNPFLSKPLTLLPSTPFLSLSILSYILSMTTNVGLWMLSLSFKP